MKSTELEQIGGIDRVTKSDVHNAIALRRVFANLDEPLEEATLWPCDLSEEYAYVYRRDPSNSLPSVQATNVFVGSVGNVLGDYGNFNTPRTWGVDVNLSF